MELSICENLIHLTIALLSTRARIDFFPEKKELHGLLIVAEISMYYVVSSTLKPVTS
jgi:hypothetical protein